MNEFLDSNLLRTFEQNVCTIDICVGEGVRISKAQVDVGLCGKMEDGVDVVSLQTVHDF